MEETTALAQYSAGPTDLMAGLGITPQEAIKPSNLILVQKPEQGTPGLFKDVDAKFEYETIQAVPIAFFSGRVMFPEGSSFGDKPLCRSNDGDFPVINDDLVRQDGGKGCRKCSMSQWKKINGRTIKPSCMETASIIFVDAFTEFIYRMNVKGTAIIPTRNLREALHKFALMTKAKGRLIPPFGTTVEISSTQVISKKGTYYALNFGAPTPVQDEAAYERYKAIYEGIVLKKNLVADDEADPIEDIMEAEYVAA